MKKLILLLALTIYFCNSFYAQIYVDASATGNNDGTTWENAYNHLSDAIAAASADAEIWVAAGTYKPGGLATFRDTSFYLNTDIRLYGGFEGTEASLDQRGDYTNFPTVLSGDVNDNDLPDEFVDARDDNCKHVFWIDTNVTNSTIIDGFYIQAGHTDGADSTGNDRRGGGMLSYGAPIVQNCTFTANYGYFGGAAYPRFGAATDIQFINCEFLNNRAQFGGALYINSIDNGLFKDCSFRRNVSGGFAGAVYNQNSIDSFVNCDFLENVASGNSRGGAMYTTQSMVVFEDCGFNNNEAASRTGGALHFSDGDESTLAIIRNCNFLANVGRWGGAITAYGTNTVVEVSNCDFNLNEASTAGGAVSVGFQANMFVDSCTFEENESANIAGAIFLQNDTSSLTMTHTSLLSNSAENDGGAIHTFSGSQIEIRDCLFESNSAALGLDGGFGGAISFSEDSLNLASLNIERSQFLANSASDQGGAISLVNVDASITNSLFIFNSVGPAGIAGAISNNATSSRVVPTAPLLLVNNTFSFNEGGLAAGIVAWEDGEGGMASVSMQNNVFFHLGLEDIAVEDGDPEFISLGGNLSGSATSSVFLDANSDIVGADPMFRDPSQLDFNITFDSPCRDAGVNDGAPEVDIRGVERDDSVDIGCYEWAMVNTLYSHEKNFKLDVYPAVSKDMVTISAELGGPLGSSAFLDIYSADGILWDQKEVPVVDHQVMQIIPVSRLPVGRYYIILRNKKSYGVGSFIIQE